MNKRRIRHITEWLIVFILLIIYFNSIHTSFGSFDPLKTYEQLEKRHLFGPSEIVKVVDSDRTRKTYLGVYQDQWFSAKTVIKKGFMWYPSSSHSIGVPIKEDEKVSYSWNISQQSKKLRLAHFYGYVSDPQIEIIELVVEESKEGKMVGDVTLREQVNVYPMFLMSWNEEIVEYKWKLLRGLDKDGKVLYEKELR